MRAINNAIYTQNRDIKHSIAFVFSRFMPILPIFVKFESNFGLRFVILAF